MPLVRARATVAPMHPWKARIKCLQVQHGKTTLQDYEKELYCQASKTHASSKYPALKIPTSHKDIGASSPALARVTEFPLLLYDYISYVPKHTSSECPSCAFPSQDGSKGFRDANNRTLRCDSQHQCGNPYPIRLGNELLLYLALTIKDDSECHAISSTVSP